MTAVEACMAIAAGMEDHIAVTQIPVADGGDGMASTLTSALKGRWIEIQVNNALRTPVTAGYGLIDNGRTAVIEMAEASGLHKIGDSPKDPWRATTFGTGELIRDAINRGVRKILLGIGGSATNDGGTGMAEALGFRFSGIDGIPLSNLPANLEKVERITPPDDFSNFPEITVACDVTNPLLGPDGATTVYGPQKGINFDDLPRHESRLRHLVRITDGTAMGTLPGSGAAGGLGFGALYFLHASLQPGFEIIAGFLQLEKAISEADLIITGEGKIDGQSLQGKAPTGVAQLAKKYGKPVYAFCGLLGDGDFSDTFDKIWQIDRGNLSVEESMKCGFDLLKKTAVSAAPEISRSL